MEREARRRGRRRGRGGRGRDFPTIFPHEGNKNSGKDKITSKEEENCWVMKNSSSSSLLSFLLLVISSFISFFFLEGRKENFPSIKYCRSLSPDYKLLFFLLSNLSLNRRKYIEYEKVLFLSRFLSFSFFSLSLSPSLERMSFWNKEEKRKRMIVIHLERRREWTFSSRKSLHNLFFLSSTFFFSYSLSHSLLSSGKERKRREGVNCLFVDHTCNLFDYNKKSERIKMFKMREEERRKNKRVKERKK